VSFGDRAEKRMQKRVRAASVVATNLTLQRINNRLQPDCGLREKFNHTNLKGDLQMKNILATLRTLHNDESGQDLIEYALAASLIALGAITAMSTLSTAINTVFTSITTKLNAA